MLCQEIISTVKKEKDATKTEAIDFITLSFRKLYYFSLRNSHRIKEISIENSWNWYSFEDGKKIYLWIHHTFAELERNSQKHYSFVLRFNFFPLRLTNFWVPTIPFSMVAFYSCLQVGAVGFVDFLLSRSFLRILNGWGFWGKIFRWRFKWVKCCTWRIGSGIK